MTTQSPENVPSDDPIIKALNLDTFVDRPLHDSEFVMVSMGALRRAWAAPTTVGVPDKLDVFRDDDAGRCAFVSGWNSCRAAMLASSATPPAPQHGALTDEGTSVAAGEGQEPVKFDDWFTGYVESIGGLIYNSASIHMRAAWSAAQAHPAPQAAQPAATRQEMLDVAYGVVNKVTSACERAAVLLRAMAAQASAQDASKPAQDERGES